MDEIKFNENAIDFSIGAKSIEEANRNALKERIKNDFTYHKPNEDNIVQFNTIRDEAREYALKLVDTCPQSRELSLALTKLEEVVFFANAAVARNQEEENDE